MPDRFADVLEEARAFLGEEEPDDLAAAFGNENRLPAFLRLHYGHYRQVASGKPEPDLTAQVAEELRELRNLIVHANVSLHPSVLDAEAREAADLTLVLELAHLKAGGWVALSHLFDQYGEGDTAAQAVDDLLVTLYEDRELLRAEGGSLSDRLRAELQRLEGTLPEEIP